MKKVLIIAHLFHASPRIPGLAKYLPEFGWEPIVLTGSFPQMPVTKFRTIETHYRETLGFWKKLLKIKPEEDVRAHIKKKIGATCNSKLVDFALTRIGEIANYPDSEKGWKSIATGAGARLLEKEEISAIISSSSPVTSHIIAKELKNKYHVRWVADLRDPWSQNHNYYYGPLRRLVDKRLELKTLSQADALVIVSDLWAENLKILHHDKAVHVITNGFDPDEIKDPPAKLLPKFTITYTGTIYPGMQDHTRFFAALKSLLASGNIDPDHIEVRFYGAGHEWLEKEILKYGLQKTVREYGWVPQKTAIQKQRESHVLLLFTWEGKKTAALSSKIFEYLAAQRPILATGRGNDPREELLLTTGTGRREATEEEIRVAVMDFYSQYKLTGKLNYFGDREQIDKYSHREMARKFAEILERI